MYVLLEYLVLTVLVYSCIDCGRYTSSGNVTGGETSTVYAVLVEWPSNNSVLLGALSSHRVSSVEMLGLTGKVCSVFTACASCNVVLFIPIHRNTNKVLISF